MTPDRIDLTPPPSVSVPPGATLARRDVLAAFGAGAAAMLSGGIAAAAGQDAGAPSGRPPHVTPVMPAEFVGWDSRSGRYILPELPYRYDALEPVLDEETVRLHHDVHHAGYVRGLNQAIDALAEIRDGGRDAGEIKRWSRQLAFNGSGHFLHVIYWTCMDPRGGGPPGAPIAEHIERSFGSFDKFSLQFQAAAASVEGSGWGLLVLEPTSRRLLVMQAEKHQNLTAWGAIPLIAVDVWEHAYYLRYQNRRKEYVAAFMNLVNWDFVSRMHAGVLASLEG